LIANINVIFKASLYNKVLYNTLADKNIQIPYIEKIMLENKRQNFSLSSKIKKSTLCPKHKTIEITRCEEYYVGGTSEPD